MDLYTKLKLQCNDIFQLYSLLDKENAKMPKFVAENVSRVPSIEPSEVDIVSLMKSMVELKSAFAQLSSDILELKNKKDDLIQKELSNSRCEIQSERVHLPLLSTDE